MIVGYFRPHAWKVSGHGHGQKAFVADHATSDAGIGVGVRADDACRGRLAHPPYPAEPHRLAGQVVQRRHVQVEELAAVNDPSR
jgi:hypothetical protein